MGRRLLTLAALHADGQSGLAVAQRHPLPSHPRRPWAEHRVGKSGRLARGDAHQLLGAPSAVTPVERAAAPHAEVHER